jgi:hypothetical protein
VITFSIYLFFHPDHIGGTGDDTNLASFAPFSYRLL